MKWKKVPPELNRLLDDSISPFAANRRSMFGASTYFVNGNMFAGIHGERVILRLSEVDRRQIQSQFDEVTPFEPVEGRIMKEYVALPESVYSQPNVLKKWLDRSYRYAQSLKPKAPSKKK